MKERKKDEECAFLSLVSDNIVCLICIKVVQAPKECSLHLHYETLH